MLSAEPLLVQSLVQVPQCSAVDFRSTHSLSHRSELAPMQGKHMLPLQIWEGPQPNPQLPQLLRSSALFTQVLLQRSGG